LHLKHSGTGIFFSDTSCGARKLPGRGPFCGIAGLSSCCMRKSMRFAEWGKSMRLAEWGPFCVLVPTAAAWESMHWSR
jgi:hypothetical protein